MLTRPETSEGLLRGGFHVSQNSVRVRVYYGVFAASRFCVCAACVVYGGNGNGSRWAEGEWVYRGAGGQRCGDEHSGRGGERSETGPGAGAGYRGAWDGVRFDHRGGEINSGVRSGGSFRDGDSGAAGECAVVR